MANTYELISSSTVGAGGASSIDFTSIPNTYTDLVLQFSLRDAYASQSDIGKVTFNGSSSAIYTGVNLRGDGSGNASSILRSNQTYFFLGEAGTIDGANSTANTFSNGSIYIPNYAGSSNKTVSVETVTETNATAAVICLWAGLWASTAAITSIKIESYSASNFVQYSTAYLYGVKNA